MNFNPSVYANAVTPLTVAFKISGQAARVGQMIFLVAFAFRCGLWAPWSEDLGRWPILQLSLFLVNIWQIPCALAPNYSTIIGFRFLGGLSSAGGSVTLSMVADMWEADNQQHAVAYIVLSSVGGSALWTYCGCLHSATSELALELLGSAHLWCGCSAGAFLPCTRDKILNHCGPRSQEAAQGRRDECIWAERAQGVTFRTQKDPRYLVAPFRDVRP